MSHLWSHQVALVPQHLMRTLLTWMTEQMGLLIFLHHSSLLKFKSALNQLCKGPCWSLGQDSRFPLRCQSPCSHAQVNPVLSTEPTSYRPVLPLLGSETLIMAARQAGGTRVKLGSSIPGKIHDAGWAKSPWDIPAHKSRVEDTQKKSVDETSANCTGTSVATMDLEVKVVHNSSDGGEQPC